MGEQLILGNDRRVYGLPPPLGAAQPHDADVLDQGRPLVVQFELDGIDVLARRRNDHILLPPRDEQKTVVIDMADVPRAKIPVLRKLLLARRIEVSRHDRRTAQQDLAVTILIGMIDLHIDPSPIRTAHRTPAI